MSESRVVGVVGLGVMGRNLALNMADHGNAVVTFDPWEDARKAYAEELSQTGVDTVRVVDDYADFVQALSTPRMILMMVKAGDPVDAVIAALQPHLSPGDTLIDGGNSYFPDTVRREATLREAGLNFIGLGVSGGEEGARNGPSLMAGGSAEAYAQCRPVLEAIAAQFQGAPCCARVGGDGAGHFVKTVHNGIEYGIMQAIAETYVMLRDVAGLDHAAMADVFRAWNATDLSSYLVEITAEILARKDDLSDAPLVEMILDKAGQKGTGRWSSEFALALGVPASSITESVYARALAALKDERVRAADVLTGPRPEAAGGDTQALIETLRQGLLATTISIFAQGLGLIAAGSREHGWETDLALTAKIWRDGCVIRAALLDDIATAYEEDAGLQNLMCAPRFAKRLAALDAGWRDAVCVAVKNGVPVPALTSALSYYDGYRSANVSANMIQAQRDFFGAHTYERKDRDGTFHTPWTKG